MIDVVEEIVCWEVVWGVDYYVWICDDFVDVWFVYVGFDWFDWYVGVEFVDECGGVFGFWCFYVVVVVDDLLLEVVLFDYVVVDYDEFVDVDCCEVLDGWCV